MVRFLGAVVMALFAIGCTESVEPPFRVGTNTWPGYESLYLARDLGYYHHHDIKLVQLPSATEVIRGFRNGTLEAAALTMDEVFILADQGLDPRIVLVMDISNGGDVVLGGGGITKLADLEGKKVGVENTALGAFMLLRSLQVAGMAADDVKMVPLEVHEHYQAFVSGKVDAVVTFEPVRTKLLEQGANLLFDSSRIPGEIVDVLVVSASTLTDRRKELRQLLNGWFRAVDYLKNEPEKASATAATREGLTPAQFREALKGLRIPDLEENRELLTIARPSLADRITALADMMMANGLLHNRVDPAHLLAPGPVQGVQRP